MNGSISKEWHNLWNGRIFKTIYGKKKNELESEFIYVFIKIICELKNGKSFVNMKNIIVLYIYHLFLKQQTQMFKCPDNRYCVLSVPYPTSHILL